MNKWASDLERINSWRSTQQQLARQIKAKPRPTDQDQGWLEEVSANMKDSQELEAELQDAGVPFTADELINLSAPYPEAIPILIKHLRTHHRPGVEESIVRALTVKYGGDEVFDALYEHLLQRRDSMRDSTLFALGNALAVVGGKHHESDLVRIAADPQNRNARHEPLLKLGQMRSTSVDQLAKRLLDEGKYPLVAIRALRRARVWSAVDTANALLSPDVPSEIRAEVRKYLAAAEKHNVT